jgi:anaerobic C4-dicarboxylate transporter-like protein
VKRLVTIAVACVLLGLAGFVAASTFDTHGSVAAPNQTTEGTTTTETTVPTATTTSVTTTSAPTSPTPEPAETTTSTSDWLLIAIEGLIVVGFIALGVRSGGIGLGLWGGVGTLILVFVFGLDPGEPPFDAMLIIVAVISAAAAMQAAGGIDYMVQIASKALRARPSAINFVAPYVSYLLCILTGTSNTFFSIIPVINEVTYANKIRPERTLGASTVASAMGITSSPVAAAMATLLPLVEIYDYNLVDVLLITIPASIVGIFVMSLIMSRHGKDLEDDAEYLRRLEAGEVQPPAAAGEIELLPYAKRSVAIFLGAVLVIVLFGLFEGIRPTVASEDGGVEPLSVTPIIQMVMLTAAALMLLLAHVRASDIPRMSIFTSGMVAMIALFGIAWMADTFIANNEDAIVGALGDLASKWPFMIAVAIFLVAALTTSQSAATRTMVPLGLALGIGAGYMIAMWTAVMGVLFLPANGTQIAAAEADTTGTTTLGKRVIDHSFQLPLQVAWIVTALVGMAIVAVFH